MGLLVLSVGCFVRFTCPELMLHYTSSQYQKISGYYTHLHFSARPPIKLLGVVPQSLMLESIITKSIGYRDPVKQCWTHPPLIILIMKTSFCQFAQRRLSTRNWASESWLFAPWRQTLNSAPAGCRGSMTRRKNTSIAEKKSGKPYYATTPVL